VGVLDTEPDLEASAVADAQGEWLALLEALPVAEGDALGGREGECVELGVGDALAPLPLGLPTALPVARVALCDALDAAVCEAVAGPVGAAEKETVAVTEGEPVGHEDKDADALAAAEGDTLGVVVPEEHRVRVPVAEPLTGAEGVLVAEARSEMLPVMTAVRVGVGYTEMDTEGAPDADVVLESAGVTVTAKKPVADTVEEP
jgi:hypothetical protein